MLTLTLRVTQKYVFRPPKIKAPFICHESFSPKFSYAKKKYGAMLKKERDTWSSQSNNRNKKKKMEHMKVPKYWKKREITHTSKAIIKREKVMIKGVPKILGLEKKYSTHLHILIKVYGLYLLGSGFWLNNICDVSMPLVHTYLKLHSKPFRCRMKRR